MIQGDLHASHVIKDKGEQFQKEVVDRLLEVRKGFVPEDVQSCRMSIHGEDIILSPRARAVLPITVECKAQKRHAACATWKQAHRQAKELCLSVQPEPVAFIKVDGEVPLVVIRAEYALALLTAAPDGVRAGLTWG
ncbi:hypothetical protein N9C56_06590 [Paracoccaceae bacterium]|nr:hypothetical protein [Paracoccaceae bacterium]